MRLEDHTLPLIALVVFMTSFGFGILAFDTTENRLSERTLSFRAAPFGNQAAQVGSLAEDSGGLVAYWAFDEGESVTVLDKSGNGNAGVINGNPVWVSGKSGKALFFDGMEDYVSVADNPTLDISQAFTITAWVKPDASASGVVLSKNGLEAGALGGYELALYAGQIAYSVHGWASLSAGSAEMDPFDWTYATITFDEQTDPTAQLYINGEHVLSSKLNPPSPNAQALVIGRNNDGSHFKGNIDEVRIYDRALSPVEVQELYHSYDAVEEEDSFSITQTLLGNAVVGLFANFVSDLTQVFNAR